MNTMKTRAATRTAAGQVSQETYDTLHQLATDKGYGSVAKLTAFAMTKLAQVGAEKLPINRGGM